MGLIAQWQILDEWLSQKVCNKKTNEQKDQCSFNGFCSYYSNILLYFCRFHQANSRFPREKRNQGRLHWEDVCCSSQNLCCSGQYSGPGQPRVVHCRTFLTVYQTTYFRLFQTERVCRRQFQI